MLTHVKELIEQNAEKMRMHWPNAPMGIYSASIGKKQLGEPITFAGIQSVRSKARMLGHIDLVIIDECHLVNHRDEGGYRHLLSELTAINPALRVVGLTATPYRLGHGLITDKPALFDALIEPVSIEELVYKGYLAPLRSKVTKAKLDTSGVRKRGGEFIESELQAAVDTDDNNQRVVREVIELAGDRKAWLFFCTGVKHAEHVAEVLRQHGIAAECVTGATPKKEREQILADFKAGRLRALTNANVLTTGCDYPDIDLIAMLRPTMSPSLYVQMAGRGMRVKSHTDHCLVLDFAGVVATHGPITAVRPPNKAGDGNGEAPVKVCDNCGELCAIAVSICPACGHPFPGPERKKLELRDDDIMGLEGMTLDVTGWIWRKHVSRSSGKEMLACTYYGALSDRPVTEYLPVLHDGYAGQKAMRQLLTIANSSGAHLAEAAHMEGSTALDYIAAQMNKSRPPTSIEYRMDGKFHRVLKRSWT
jgi:DNA repair protein RadD